MQKENTSLNSASAAEVISAGQTLVKIETAYHTAISVQIPRNLQTVKEKAVEEAEQAGELFYYSWLVHDKQTGEKKLVEDLGIHAALALLRYYTNCAAPIDIVETGGQLYFRASFIDLEFGYTLSRLYPMPKVKAVGKYDSDRWADMVFQKAQSQAQRNVILGGIPLWIRREVLATAKETALKKIEEEKGLAVQKQNVLGYFKKYNILRETLENYLDVKFEKWTAEEILGLRSAARMINDEAETPESLFGEHMKKEDENGISKIENFWNALAPYWSDDKDNFVPTVEKYMGEFADFMAVPVQQFYEIFIEELCDENGIIIQDKILKVVRDIKEGSGQNKIEDEEKRESTEQTEESATREPHLSENDSPRPDLEAERQIFLEKLQGASDNEFDLISIYDHYLNRNRIEKKSELEDEMIASIVSEEDLETFITELKNWYEKQQH